MEQLDKTVKLVVKVKRAILVNKAIKVKQV